MPTALLSVSNKKGLVELANELSKLGWSLLASGGTAAALRDASLTVQDVATYTGSPEILGGRVKTLHPAVHGGILARDTVSDQTDLTRIQGRLIDLVVVNLYPFQETVRQEFVSLAEAIENIDIGGVALIRAAAKNYSRVSVVTDPSDYTVILSELQNRGQISLATRERLAVKAYTHTAGYDTAIAAFLAKKFTDYPAEVAPPAWLSIYPGTELRYGENPHQKARLYLLDPQAGPLGGEVLQGKALSYNNLLDLDSAWRAALSFGDRPTVAIVKHLSPCGIASANSIPQAFALALQSDPVSAFGGVIAANGTFDIETVEAMGSLFASASSPPNLHLRRLRSSPNAKTAAWSATHTCDCSPNMRYAP